MESNSSPSSPSRPLAADFEPRDLEQWRQLARAGLPEGALERLGEITLDGLRLRPLYAAGDAVEDPGAIWSVRRGGLGRSAAGPELRQLHADPDPEAGRAAILRDLEGGASSIELRFDRAGRAGQDAPATGSAVDGMALSDLAALERVLDGVHLEMIEVALDAGAAFRPAAALLLALYRRRGLGPEQVRGAVNADPVGTLAAAGELPQGVGAALDELGELVEIGREYPGLRLVRIDTLPWHDAGCSDVQELGLALASGVAYLRRLVEAGLGVEEASARMTMRLALDPDFFASLVKLRAARLLWSRVLEASGAHRDSPPLRLEAVTGRRALTRYDPWVNLLRGTATTFAAVVGGADVVVTAPFDAVLGLPGPLGSRLARNTQLVLTEESGLHRVADPGGGSWYLEQRTRELATAAWTELQRLEHAGGVVAGLRDGTIGQWIDEIADRRAEQLARRTLPLTGTSEYPDLEESLLEPPRRDPAALARRAAAALAERRPDDAEELRRQIAEDPVAAALAGATLGQLSRPRHPERVDALPRRRWAEPFERLRDAAEVARQATGQRPQVFLAVLGERPEYGARVGFVRNLLAAGGLGAVIGDETDTGDPGAIAAAFRASDLVAAVICSSDERYAELAEPMLRELKAAGAEWVALAGRPGELRSALDAAGLDRALHLGGDALEVLRELHRLLGLAGIESGPEENER